ncbi:hypothetical protein WJX73_004429 [Symbiochloris irregularis]|uniref:Uncharacterized protein n=1 Tax=Symbiochloris irregularis TaxID=706552 RepID=A0AAW1NU69_9CHLO
MAIAPVAPVAPAYSDAPVPPVAVAPVGSIPNIPDIPPIPPVPYTPANLVTQTLGDLASNAILGINQANPDTVPAINPALVPTLEAQANANNAASSNANNGLVNLLSSLTGQPIVTTTYRPATVGRKLLQQLLGDPLGQTIPASQLTTFRGANAVANALTGLNGQNGTTILSPGRTTVIPGPSITRDTGRRLADEAHGVGAVPIYHTKRAAFPHPLNRRRMPHNQTSVPFMSRIHMMFSRMFRAPHEARSSNQKGRSFQKIPVHHAG